MKFISRRLGLAKNTARFKNEKRIKHFGCTTGRYHLKYLGRNGRIILMCI
jgi:hypothetical protein